jgi:hypothetical protein
MLFSQRIGIKPIKQTVQIDSMDDDLRNCLWNVLRASYWDRLPNIAYDQHMQTLLRSLWMSFFKLPFDDLPIEPDDIYDYLKKYFYKTTWVETYDFIEFVALSYPVEHVSEDTRNACNIVLEREVSAYRFVGEHLTQITSDVEIKEIEQATKNQQLKKALNLFSDRKHPDYRNSIKESISAVEAICRKLTNESTLDRALKKIQQKIYINEQLKQGLEKIYHYTNGPDGIRHAVMEESKVGADEAKFMLVTCSAFVNYLTAKAEALKN